MIRCHILTRLGFQKSLKVYGEWAIVTGATDGIGRSYANELAKQGLKIVLVSRSQVKLEKVAKEIEETYGVKTKYIVFDFSQPEGYDKIKEIIEPLNVGVLVNNVGMSGPWDRVFDESDVQEHINVMRTNTFGEIHLTHMLTRKMVAKKCGVMIHISSFFGYIPSLGMISVYAPTKAFINGFVENLQAETAVCEDIHHQLVNPFFVVTNMTDKVVKISSVTPDAASFVSSAIRTVGITSQTFGYWTHDIIGSFLVTFPLSVFKQLPFCQTFKRKCRYRRLKIMTDK